MRFDSLKTRLIIWFIGIITICLLGFSIAFYYYFNKSFISQIKDDLYQYAFNIEEKLENNKPIYENNILILKDNKIFYKGSNFNVKYNINKQFEIRDLGEKLQAIFILEFKKPFNGYVIVSKIIDDKSEDVVDSMIVIEPILLLILIFITIKIVDKLLKPIDEITNISKEISINNFSSTIPNNYKEYEIKELINSFNEMILRLQEGVENLDRFNSDVSHELKTPLTIIKGEIDVTLKKIRDEKYYINTLKTIENEIKEMQSIINNLLLLTKYTKDNISRTFSKCDLDMILLQVMQKYEKVDKNIDLNIENIEYFGNSQLLYHMFLNLVDNAIKYSKNNINIKLYKKEKIYFEISDDGEGIDTKYLDKVTKRFFRVEKSRNKNIKGFGLGLSIVKKAVELHNGNLYIESKDGLKVVISL